MKRIAALGALLVVLLASLGLTAPAHAESYHLIAQMYQYGGAGVVDGATITLTDPSGTSTTSTLSGSSFDYTVSSQQPWHIHAVKGSCPSSCLVRDMDLTPGAYNVVTMRAPIRCSTPGVVSGTPNVGETLTGAPGGTAESGYPATATYRWFTRAVGSTVSYVQGFGQTYVPSDADRGQYVGVLATLTSTDGWGSSECPAATAPSVVGARLPFAVVVPPTLAGAPKVKRVYTVDVGAYRPTDATLTFQWFRTRKHRQPDAIPGANGTSYVPRKKDVGSRLSVMVIYSRAGILPVSRTTAPSPKVRNGRH